MFLLDVAGNILRYGGTTGWPRLTAQRGHADVPGDRHGVPARLGLAGATGLPGTYLGAADYLGWPRPNLFSAMDAAVFGLVIVGAAYVLSWAAEASQVDVSTGLAVAVLAMVAILPEYAVDLVFTFQAGRSHWRT